MDQQQWNTIAAELEQLRTQLLALPLESRAWLAQALVESLDQESANDVDALWIEEIRRRDAEVRNGTAVLKPVDQVLKEAHDRLKCSR